METRLIVGPTDAILAWKKRVGPERLLGTAFADSVTGVIPGARQVYVLVPEYAPDSSEIILLVDACLRCYPAASIRRLMLADIPDEELWGPLRALQSCTISEAADAVNRSTDP